MTNRTPHKTIQSKGGPASRHHRTTRVAWRVAEELESRLLLSIGFAPPLNLPTGGSPTAITDYGASIAVANGQNSSVQFFAGDGAGNFGAPVAYPTGSDPTAIAVLRDAATGLPTALVTADAGSGDVSVLLGQTDSSGNNPTFLAPVDTHVVPANSGPLALAVENIIGYGGAVGEDYNSVAVAGPDGLFLLASNPPPTTPATANASAKPLAAEAGTFQPPVKIADGSFSGVTFFGANYKSEIHGIAATDPVNGQVDVFLRQADGTYAPAGTYDIAKGVSGIAATSSGSSDQLAAAVPSEDAVYLLSQNGISDGSFDTPFMIQLDQSPVSVRFGGLGIVTANSSDHSVTVINNDGTYDSKDYPVGTQPVALAVADFNGDGYSDLAVADATGSANVLLQGFAQLQAHVTASPKPVVIGQPITFVVTVNNTGYDTATNVTLDDYLPELVSATASQGTVITSPERVQANLGEIAPGNSATLTLVVRPSTYGPATDNVWVGTDSHLAAGSNLFGTDTVQVIGSSGAQVAITETGDSSVDPGGTPSYHLTVTNYGPNTAQGLTLSDTLAANSIIASAGASQGTVDASVPGLLTAALGNLAAGASATVDFSVNLTTNDPATNTATVTAADPSTDPYPADNTASFTTNVNVPVSPIPAKPRLSIGNVTQTDSTSGKKNFVFTVTRTGSLSGNSTVHFQTVDGTAKAGKNYLNSTGQVSFPKRISKATVSVPVLGSNKYAPNEIFLVTLSKPANAVLAHPRGVGTIVSAVKKPAPLIVNVNFEPKAGPAVAGYVADTGTVYGVRSGGLYFGWSSDNQSHAIIRHIAKDARYDTFNVLGSGGAANWSIALPNGQYSVSVFAGDARGIAATCKVNANGTSVVSGKTSAASPFASGTAIITVTNGRLTLTPGLGTLSDKLDFVMIKGLV